MSTLPRSAAARPVAVAIALAAAALLLVIALAGPASAHAVLEGGSVFDGQVLETAPEELFLDFNEAVSAPRSGLRVYDGAGERVDEGGTFQTDDAADLVRVQLAEGLPDGTYAVTYRVTSADGHPVDGAFVFSVGEESGAADELLGQVFSGDADRPWAVAAALARWVMYGGTLLAAGAVLATWWLRRDLVDGAPEAEVLGIRRLVRLGAIAAVAATALGVLLQTVLVGGDGLASLADAGGLVAVATSFVGISAAVRLLAAGGLWAAARRGAVHSGSAAALGLAALTSLLLEGHTLTTGPAAVVWGGAAVHVLSGALWLGGLAVLAVVLRARRRADDPVGAGRVVARFSSLFTVSVVAVLVAGSALSWAEVRAVRALTETSYGWVLLAKVVAVLPLLAIGLWNNRKLVPVLAARRRRSRTRTAPAVAGVISGGSDEAADRSRARDDAWRLLGRMARIEVGIMALVLALTGVLVSLQPAAEAAGITGAYSETVPFEGIGQMTFTVDPNRSGRNEIHLYLLGDTGRPVDVAEEITMSLSQPELDIGPIVREPIPAGPGHFILSGPELSVPGRWEITTDVALNRFDVVSATVDVVVNP